MTPWAVAGAVAVSFAASGGWFLRGVFADRALQEASAEFNKEKAEAERRYGRQVSSVLDRSHELSEKSNEDIEQGRREIQRLDSSRRALAAESARLRQRVAEVAASCGSPSGGPPASGDSPTGRSPGLVLAKLWGGAEEEAVELGPALDDAIARGQACERAYNRVRDTIHSMKETP